MKRFIFLISFSFIASSLIAQVDAKEELSPEAQQMKAQGIKPATAKNVNNNSVDAFNIIRNNEATSVKNQDNTGTCWSFSTTSLLESQALKNKLGSLDLSEMYTVRNIYVEKARNYVLRQGHAQFSEGGLGHDVIRAVSTYGAVPNNVYSGLNPGQKYLDHQKMFDELKHYLDSIIDTKNQPLSADWLNGFNKILDTHLGTLSEGFKYNDQRFTPQSFAKDVLKFNASDYVNITSFTHHPFYQSFILEVPDNFSNGFYYNLPLNEMISLVKTAISAGYTVLWDADVSNNGFDPKSGLAMLIGGSNRIADLKSDMTEESWDQNKRQLSYENLTTQDDHLMHITGIEKNKAGKTFFIVKNSWGNNGPYNGYMNVSESYFAINTVSLVVPKAAIPKLILDKLKIAP